MKRLTSCVAAIVLTAVLVQFPGQGSAAAPREDSPSTSEKPASSSAACTWKWKKKRVVKWVRRHGKRVKVVRYRHRRVCVPVATPAPARLGVKAFEYGLILSAGSIESGDTIIELSNRGEDAHDLHIARLDDTDGSSEKAVPVTPPSTFNRIRFDTAPGTYRLWCSLPTHADLGMRAELTVTDGPGS